MPQFPPPAGSGLKAPGEHYTVEDPSRADSWFREVHFYPAGTGREVATDGLQYRLAQDGEIFRQVKAAVEEYDQAQNSGGHGDRRPAVAQMTKTRKVDEFGNVSYDVTVGDHLIGRILKTSRAWQVEPAPFTSHAPVSSVKKGMEWLALYAKVTTKATEHFNTQNSGDEGA